MPVFKPGHQKLPGRPRGAKNKKTNLEERLRLLDFDPIDTLINLLKKGDLTDKDKAHISLELIQYLQPKLKAIEHTGKDGGPLLIEQSGPKLLDLMKDLDSFTALETLDKKLNESKPA